MQLISYRIGMNFGAIVLQLKTRRLTRSDFRFDVTQFQDSCNDVISRRKVLPSCECTLHTKVVYARRQAAAVAACDVIGSLHALQFLIYSTFALVTSVSSVALCCSGYCRLTATVHHLVLYVNYVIPVTLVCNIGEFAVLLLYVRLGDADGRSSRNVCELIGRGVCHFNSPRRLSGRSAHSDSHLPSTAYGHLLLGAARRPLFWRDKMWRRPGGRRQTCDWGRGGLLTRNGPGGRLCCVVIFGGSVQRPAAVFK